MYCVLRFIEMCAEKFPSRQWNMSEHRLGKKGKIMWPKIADAFG